MSSETPNLDGMRDKIAELFNDDPSTPTLDFDKVPEPIAQLFNDDPNTPSIVFDDGYTTSYHGSYEYGEDITRDYLHWLNEEMAHYILRRWTRLGDNID